MRIEVNNLGHTILYPDEGKYLTNGDTYSDSAVYLGNIDSPNNWTEVDSIPEEEGEQNDII